jgi:hypothetical protein
MSRNDHVHFGDLLLERDSLRESLKLAVEAMSKAVTAFKNQETMNESVIGLAEALATSKAKNGEL